MSKPYLLEPLTVYRNEFAEIEAMGKEFHEKIWVLMDQMEEGMKEFALEDPLIAKQYENAYDILEALATNVSMSFDMYLVSVKKGKGE